MGGFTFPPTRIGVWPSTSAGGGGGGGGGGAPDKRGSSACPALPCGAPSVKFTVTVMMTGTSSLFSIVGWNCHCFTASRAAWSKQRLAPKDARLEYVAGRIDCGFENDDSLHASCLGLRGVDRFDVPHFDRGLDVAADTDRRLSVDERWLVAEVAAVVVAVDPMPARTPSRPARSSS